LNTKTFFRRLIFIPLIVGGLFAVLDLVSGLDSLENKVYDLFLHWKPAVKESSKVVLLDVDEEAIDRTSSWPWPRGLIARGLETMTEIGAGYAVFDIEYVNNSPMSVDREYLDGELKADFDNFADDAGSNIGEVFNSIANGDIAIKDAADYGNQLVDLLKQGKDDLYKRTGRVAVENDSYLGKAMRLFGRASITLNLQESTINPPFASRQFAADHFSSKNIVLDGKPPTDFVDFISPIMPVATMAEGAGFTNVPVDADGVRRRIDLVEEVGGKPYLQLAFAPLRRMLGDPEIVYRKGSVLLKGALYNGQKTDVSIPIDESGKMLIRWPKKKFDASFAPHVSFYRLLEYRNNEDTLVQNLRALRTVEAWRLLPGQNPVDTLLADWKAEEDARFAALDSGTGDDRAAWLSLKAKFKGDLADFLAQGYDSRIPSMIQAAKAKAAAKDRPLYDDLSGRFTGLYTNCKDA